MKNLLATFACIVIIAQIFAIHLKNELIEQQQILIDKQSEYILKLKGQSIAQNQKHKELLSSLEYVGGVKVTMYNAVPEQTDDTPYITASGDIINPDKASEHRWIAVSRDLHIRWGGKLNFGDIVYVQGADRYDGVYVVKDTMNSRWKSRIDVLRTEGSEPFKIDEAYIFRISKTKAYLFTSLNHTSP